MNSPLLCQKARPGSPSPHHIGRRFPHPGHRGMGPPRCHSRVPPWPLILLTAKEPPAGQPLEKNLSCRCSPASSMVIIKGWGDRQSPKATAPSRTGSAAPKAGDLAAAQPLWDRYFQRLVLPAPATSSRLGHRSARRRYVDAAALSVFDSFCDTVGQRSVPAGRHTTATIGGGRRRRRPPARRRRPRPPTAGTSAAAAALFSMRRPWTGRDPGPGGPALYAIVGSEPTFSTPASVAEEQDSRLLRARAMKSLRRIALLNRRDADTLDDIPLRSSAPPGERWSAVSTDPHAWDLS